MVAVREWPSFTPLQYNPRSYYAQVSPDSAHMATDVGQKKSPPPLRSGLGKMIVGWESGGCPAVDFEVESAFDDAVDLPVGVGKR